MNKLDRASLAPQSSERDMYVYTYLRCSIAKVGPVHAVLNNATSVRNLHEDAVETCNDIVQ